MIWTFSGAAVISSFSWWLFDSGISDIVINIFALKQREGEGFVVFGTRLRVLTRNTDQHPQSRDHHTLYLTSSVCFIHTCLFTV
jgi:hypothetical protein